jgi:hypothetical protein
MMKGWELLSQGERLAEEVGAPKRENIGDAPRLAVTKRVEDGEMNQPHRDLVLLQQKTTGKGEVKRTQDGGTNKRAVRQRDKSNISHH